MKINENGITREMTEEEILEMQEMSEPYIEHEEDITDKLARIESGMNKILALLEDK